MQHGTVQPELITRYTDALGAEREAPAWAVTRVEELLASVEATGDVVEVHRLSPGQPTGPLAGRTLTLEDGATVLLGDVVPDDLPIGYHAVDAEGGTGLVLHAPRRVPAARRGWVLAAQLYAARSKRSWGQGDLRDARTLATWAREAGDGLLMVNPLHAAIPGTDPQPSPYFASTRVFREPLYLAVDEVPGPKRRDLRTAQREALDGTDRIDRRRAWSAKRSALVARWPTASADPATVAAIDRWLTDDVNARYAAFCVERDPRDVGADPRFHAWLQLLVDEQVLAVGGNLVNDVAVGVDRAGADVAMWPDCFVDEGTRIGCPPDQFNTLGQDWGLPPLHPVNLRARGYEPFVRAVRAATHGAAGIRLDHVMALDRTFWIPEGASPADGVYVKYPLDEMLDVVAIEAHRAGTFVVGEDLGTVPASIPVALEARGILSYRVVSLDSNHPSSFPTRTMAAVTTHDLPTMVGLLTGSDLEDQQRLDLSPNVDGTWEAVGRLRHWVGSDGADRDAEVLRIHEMVSASPADLACVTLDDLAATPLRPNMPGTIDEWPNWRIPLPAPLGEILATDRATRLRGAMAARTPAHDGADR